MHTFTIISLLLAALLPAASAIRRNAKVRRVARIGVGATITGVGGHSVTEGLVPLDISLEVHVETDELGFVLPHPASVWADPAMRECRHLRHFVPWQPTDEQLLSHDRGLTLPNSERLRTTDYLGNGRFRIQSRFRFRPNVSAYPFETERFRFELQLRAALADRSGEALDVMLCAMPEFTALHPHADWPGTTSNRRLGLVSAVRHACEAPFERTVPVCREPPSEDVWRLGWLSVPHVFRYDKKGACVCETVPGFDPASGLDLETCGCMGGVRAASTFELYVEARASRVGAFQSEVLVPFLIVLVAHTSYIITPLWLETRFNLLNSALIALVLYHSALMTRSKRNIVSVATKYDLFLLLSFGAILVSYALTLWMMQLQHCERQKQLCQRLYYSTRHTASTVSLFLYLLLTWMCGPRDGQVLFTTFVFTGAFCALVALGNRCGVAGRICARLDASVDPPSDPAPRPHGPTAKSRELANLLRRSKARGRPAGGPAAGPGAGARGEPLRLATRAPPVVDPAPSFALY